MEHPMQKLNDLSRSLAPLKPDGTLIAVIEMSQSSWLVAGIVPGVERQPLKKLAADEIALLKLLHRWREEAEKAGRRIERTAVAFEAGRDGFWLARWLRNTEQVIYVGTLNKALFPGLRIGYAVVPRALLQGFVGARYLIDRQPATLQQAVVSEFMQQGHFAAHIRRMRQLYREQRDA